MSEAGPLLLLSPASLKHRAPNHPERPERLEAIVARLDSDPGLARLPRREPSPAPLDALTAVHHPGYVEAIQRAGAEVEEKGRGAWLDADTWVGPGSMEAALASAGATIAAVDAVLDGEHAVAFSLCRPPGHHATRDTAMGFCLFNNVAAAAQHARRRGAERVAIVDFDVHHGHGTQDLFFERADVLYISSHQSPLYPGTGAAGERGRGAGEGFTVNAPMAAGGGEAEYLEVFDEVFAPALRDFQPDLLMVSAGFDAHADDPLAQMEMTTPAFGTLARRIRGWSEELGGGRSVWTLEGGYNLEALAGGVAEVLGALT
ncbi:MAG: hypothetical protein QOE92_852 [Chloroflexota bacterium]|nr:hypothetical protein [Chloroflexota bacterium]